MLESQLLPDSQPALNWQVWDVAFASLKNAVPGAEVSQLVRGLPVGDFVQKDI